MTGPGAGWCGACLAGAGAGPVRGEAGALYRALARLRLGRPHRPPAKRAEDALCWECTAMVRKLLCFKRKCDRASALLQGMRDSHEEINAESVRKIDRVKNNLVSPYAIRINDTYDLILIEEEADNTDRMSDNEVENFDSEVKKEEPDKLFEGFEDSDMQVCHDIDNSELKERIRSGERLKSEDLHNCVELTSKNKKDELKLNFRRVKEKKASKHKSSMTKRSKPSSQIKRPNAKRTPHRKLLARQSCESFATVVTVSHGEQMEEIRRRQDTESFRKARHKCMLCYKGFMEEKAYSNHTLKHESLSGAFQCDVCKIRFQLKRHVRNHIYAVHMTKYVCKTCQHVSTSLEQATNHHKWHTGVTYKCNVCGEVSSKVTTHLSHVRLKHPSPHICAVCGRSFVSEKGLAMHRRLMHKDVPDELELPPASRDTEQHTCAECNVKFTSLAAWKQHMVLSHRDHKEFGNGCRHCGETFSTAEEYREHYRQHHKQHRHKQYASKTWDMARSCDHCGESVRSALQYYWHIRQSHPGMRYPTNNKFVCEVCGRDFKFNASLTYHRREHSGELPHRCAVCPRAFPTRAQLDKHGNVHSESRPFVCHLCPKAFKEKSALTRHIRYHSGVRPYPCDVCGKAFTEASSRKLHFRTVHLKLPAPYISKTRLKRKLASAEARGSTVYQDGQH